MDRRIKKNNYMKSINGIKKEIFKLIKKLYKAKNANSEFIPGKGLINYAGRVYDEKELINLADSSLDFWLTAGRYARKFERRLTDFLGVKYCLLVNSGSSANLLAMAALTSALLKERRLKPGDEVITTACGFPTTLNPILQNNLVPVFIDVELGNYNIQAEKIEGAISKKTKAIFIAHALGNPADLGKISEVAKKYNLWFCEDNCDSLGSRYKEKYTGSFGDISTCSFYPAHHITTGEGGAVLTNNPLLRKIILSLRDWGRDCWCMPGKDNTCGKRFKQQFGKLPYSYDHKYVYTHIGYNFKITDMQAAIGVAQIEKLRQFIKIRNANFTMLHTYFNEYKKYFILPRWSKYSKPSWFGLPIYVRVDASFTRSEIVNFLEKNKVATRVLFGGNLVKQPAYQNIKYRVPYDLKNTDLVMNNLFWIGVYPGITRQKLDYIINILDKFLNNFIKNN